MADLALDPLTGDLEIIDGKLRIIDGVDAIRQQLVIRLKFGFSEWFLDQRLGIPYIGTILIKNPDLVAVRSILREAIVETPGIVTITEFELSVNNSTRTLELTFTATTDTGEELVFDEEFIIG